MKTQQPLDINITHLRGQAALDHIHVAGKKLPALQPGRASGWIYQEPTIILNLKGEAHALIAENWGNHSDHEVCEALEGRLTDILDA